VSLCVLISPNKDTGQIGLGLTLRTPFLTLLPLWRPYLQRQSVTLWGMEGLRLEHIHFGEIQFSLWQHLTKCSIICVVSHWSSLMRIWGELGPMVHQRSSCEKDCSRVTSTNPLVISQTQASRLWHPFCSITSLWKSSASGRPFQMGTTLKWET
jgi:hypothetical protein